MTTAMETKTRTILKRILPVVMAVVMVFTMGFLPMGRAHAAVNEASLPSAYKSGYNVYKCIDISNWQGVISKNQFKKLKSKGVTHVIVRVGYTSNSIFWRHADKSYKENINNAYAAGLKVGAYYYSQAKSKKEAQKEAEKTISLLKSYKKKITLPVAFDWEWGSRLNASWARRNGSAANTKICQAYCDKIKAAGYQPMIYASASVFNGYLNRDTLHKKYKIWVAHYTNGKATSYSKPMYMWQYSSKASFGRSLTNTTYVDVNYLFVKKNSGDISKGKWVFSTQYGGYLFKVGKKYLKSQWIDLNGKRYYVDKNGVRAVGYQKIGNYYYGFNTKGEMYKNKTVKIDGKTYKFLSNGKSVLFVAKVVNVSDGLAYRSGPSTGKDYSTMGKYKVGDTFSVVRTSGKWYMAGDGKGKGYWSLSGEGSKTYLNKIAKYPQ